MAQTARPRVRILDDDPSRFVSPQEEMRLQIQLLLDENEALKARLTALENIVQTVANTRQAGPAKSQGTPEPSQAEGNGQSQDQTGLEAELRQDQAWLDEPCPFRKTGGRTWRQVASNFGDKIPMNGRGPQVPRAYLHSIENWAEAGQTIRLKAKLALEICKKD